MYIVAGPQSRLRGLGDSGSNGSMWSYLTKTRLTDLLQNAATGKLTEAQVSSTVDECAANNFKAGAGRLTMAEAKAQCDSDIRAVVNLNGGTADKTTNLFKIALLGMAGIAAISLVTR